MAAVTYQNPVQAMEARRVPPSSLGKAALKARNRTGARFRLRGFADQSGLFLGLCLGFARIGVRVEYSEFLQMHIAQDWLSIKKFMRHGS